MVVNFFMNALVSMLCRYRTGLERRLTQAPAQVFWKQCHTLPHEEVHEIIRSNIEAGRPFCLARLGGVELTIMLWGGNIPLIGRFGLRPPVLYSDTRNGASNAGIRPRNRNSYREFAKLAFENLKEIDFLAKWNTPLEYAALERTGLRPRFCDGEQVCPTMANPNNWALALHGKRVLVVSPFKNSIERQIPKIRQVWPSLPGNWRAHFRVQKFPYLIDEDCPQTWQEVWEEMRAVVNAADYDVALFGCGGLGFPLAAAAKAAGRIGIHLGGQLQFLFGIYGQRHLDQEWHARWINESWIRPNPKEVAKSAQRVEGGCYW